MRHSYILPLAFLFSCAASDQPASESAAEAKVRQIDRAFDVPALLGMNATQIAQPLARQGIRLDQDRTPREMPSGGGTEASKTYWHDTTALVVSYNPESLHVNSYFIRTKSGATRDYKTLLKLANVSEFDKRMRIEPMASVSNLQLYTGVKLVPQP